MYNENANSGGVILYTIVKKVIYSLNSYRKQTLFRKILFTNKKIYDKMIQVLE